ncbi:hypothetical protein K437DRAFT_243822 [Tilletiaria anomala UBC 951]|uniref:Shr3 amino acid permease chaperone n=1 Tax=Tilletiaria anomala (strain ATCC 24038 / CBS 436.72 / UBC 951) TaxID=1037660 RepID=A0A066WF36_TILAU|nr:uncharacterized protein K437DRAFT_243822 [Tilletiaria anomala UBC 951]KDN52351.1 hypothetical protein K437DRAFT_243822 [Tilletiaria anomala UBC 951]
MGFRTGFVIAAVSFLYGVLFIVSIYDFPLLYYSPFDEAAVEPAERFYLSLFNGPTAVQALLHGMMALGLIGLVAKLHRWTDAAKYYDGGSLVIYMAAVCMYGAVSVPNLRLIANPNNVDYLDRSSIRTQREKQAEDAAKGIAPPPPTGPMTGEERIAALRILGATNSIIVAMLAGVVLLQVSDWYLGRQEKLAKDAEREKQMAEILKVEGKKDK